MTDININITLRLSEGLEEKVERFLELLTTATHQWDEEQEHEDEDDN